MAAHRVTRVESKSWGSRLGNSLIGALVGLAMCVGGCVLLFWNEGRAVHRARALTEGRGAVVEAASEKVDSANSGKLVHLTGEAKTDETLNDPVFPVSAVAIKLRRVAEMYQWKESSDRKTRTKLGGGQETVTEYTYAKTWSESPINSANFEDKAGHENPPMPVRGETWTARDVRLGAFALSPGLLAAWNDFAELPVAADGAQPPEGYRVVDAGFYRGADPASPQIGDLRITYRLVRPGVVSVIARQVESSFASYRTRSGHEIEELLTPGAASADAMFAAEEAANRLLAWILRLVGFLVVTFGVALVLNPLAVFASVLPIAEKIVGFGVFLIALVVGGALSLVTIGIAWFFYRPVFGVALIVLAIVAVWFFLRRKSPSAATAVIAQPPPPPPA